MMEIDIDDQRAAKRWVEKVKIGEIKKALFVIDQAMMSESSLLSGPIMEITAAWKDI